MSVGTKDSLTQESCHFHTSLLKTTLSATISLVKEEGKFGVAIQSTCNDTKELYAEVVWPKRREYHLQLQVEKEIQIITQFSKQDVQCTTETSYHINRLQSSRRLVPIAVLGRNITAMMMVYSINLSQLPRYLQYHLTKSRDSSFYWIWHSQSVSTRCHPYWFITHKQLITVCFSWNSTRRSDHVISMLDLYITETLRGDSWIRQITIFLDNAAINENNVILQYLYYK